jgi:hypothetical protein
MNHLIERYLQAISRELPANQQEDILKELRSSLYDTLEGEGDGEPTEERVVALIKEMGSPRQVAAAYYPAGQYVIGPALYPMFITVLKIVLVTILSVQALLVGLSFGVAVTTRSLIQELFGLLGALPAAAGWVVLIFWAIQRFEPKAIPEEEIFDPRKLPALESYNEPVSRFEQIFSIVVNVIALAFLWNFAQSGVLTGIEGLAFFQNPVIVQFFPWLFASSVLDIVIDIVLLWRGRWETRTRVAGILFNLFSLVVLFVMFEGHSAWLRAEGISESLVIWTQDPEFFFTNAQATGMILFRMGFAIAILIIGVETAVYTYKLIRRRMNAPISPVTGLVSAHR